MDCSQCQEQLTTHIEGLLDGTELDQIESHLAACPTCRDELDGLRRLADSLMADGRAASTISLDTQIMDRIVHEQTLQLRRISMNRMIKIAIAVAALIVVGVGITYLSVDRNGNTLLDGNVAFAEVLQRIEDAKTLECTYISYAYDLEKGQIVEDSRCRWMFREPCQMRRVHYNDDGSILNIIIEDKVEGTRLFLYPSEKRAELIHLGRPTDTGGYTAHGPMDRIKVGLDREKSRPLGKKEINGREAYGFTRRTGEVRPADPYCRPPDFWIDAKTKEILLYQCPGPQLRQLRAEEARTGKLEAWRRKHTDQGSKLVFLGEEFRDIVYDSELDESLFGFDVPEGYTLETHRRPEVTERDFIQWLKVAAECFENTFPDDPSKDMDRGSLVGTDRLGEILRKGRKGLTAAEMKVYDLMHKPYDRVYQNPVWRFRDFTAGDSWRYLGKGVKLGDNSAIVCWYKPKGSSTYRVVYGDLSVKDVAPEDLPLKVESE
jgi:hypothetical protein